jgi:cytochrome c peroxidase
MKKQQLASIAFSAVLLFGLSSCRKQVDEPVTGEATNYDQVLRDILTDASNGEGLNYFVLPESNQYSLIPQDPLNPINSAKVHLGKLLFHETAIGSEAKYQDEGLFTYSCASCHHAEAGFQANVQQGIGDGGIGFGMSGEAREPNPNYSVDSLDVQPIRTPTAMNSAYQEVMLWNGQFGAQGINEGTEAQWAMGTPIFNNNFGNAGVEIQAIAGLTVHRMLVDEEICEQISIYEDLFDLAFSDWPVETRYTQRTAGLAIAAYERTILANQSPWQDWLKGVSTAMTDSEKRGAAVFFGKANCGSCHTGPALSSMTFYGYGMDDLVGPGFYGGASSENTVNLGRGGFTGNAEENYKFKTPQLYNLKDSPFMGHGGTFHSVREVVEYKNNAVSENPNVPTSQLADQFVPLGLTDQEIDDLVNFIENALYDANLMRYAPQELPSGLCFPNNDPISMIDQGCLQ